jgi:hypothetical protein
MLRTSFAGVVSELRESTGNGGMPFIISEMYSELNHCKAEQEDMAILLMHISPRHRESDKSDLP